MRYDGSNAHVLVDWKSDSAILAGANQENRLGLMLKDDQMGLYVNGKLLATASDSTLTQKGYFGVFQSAVEDSAMSVAVEEIDEWDQP